MKTIYGSLPFYDALSKQDKVRTNANIPIHCPKEQLPPFLVQVGTHTATVTSIKLVNCSGGETDLLTYFGTFPTVAQATASALGYYIQHIATALTANLPLGSHYVKITKPDVTYYSDWIHVSDMDTPMARFCKIEFSNTNNLGDINYGDGYKQVVWLEAVLNNPSNETINTGEEKDGIFIPEKIVTKYTYSIVAYVTRAMHRCLIRLPQHDTITITDELGNTYTPDPGNVTIESDWVFYDICKLTIKFNDGANSQFSWTL